MDRIRTTFVLAAALVAGGCDEVDLQNGAASVAMKTQTIGAEGLPAKAKVTNRYLAFKGRGKPGIPYAAPMAVLSGPFTFRCVAGAFSEREAARLGTSVFSVEFDSLGTNPVQYYGMQAFRVLGGGMKVETFRRGANLAATVLGSKTYDDVSRLVFDVTYDGSKISFRARPATTGAPAALDLIGETVVDTVPLVAGVAATHQPKDAEVGFDAFECAFTPVAGATPEAAVSSVYRAAAAVLHAINLVDGHASFDGAAVMAALDDALARTQTARTAVAALPAAKPTAQQKALKKLDAAIAAIKKAKKPFDAGGAVKAASAVSTLETKAAKALDDAAMAILPQGLRAYLPAARQF